jgi:hypothetical protein
MPEYRDPGAFPRTYPVNLRLAGNTGTPQNRTVSRSLTTGRVKNSVTGKVRRATGVRISIGCALRGSCDTHNLDIFCGHILARDQRAHIRPHDDCYAVRWEIPEILGDRIPS